MLRSTENFSRVPLQIRDKPITGEKAIQPSYDVKQLTYLSPFALFLIAASSTLVLLASSLLQWLLAIRVLHRSASRTIQSLRWSPMAVPLAAMAAQTLAFDLQMNIKTVSLSAC